MRETSHTVVPNRALEGRVWWAIPIVAVLASYASTFTAGFVWDDHDLIVRSPLVLGKSGIARHFTQPFWGNAQLSAHSFYRPLVTLSYALDHALWGNFAGGYHLTNVLMHVLATVLLALLCRQAGAGRPVACLLATIFAVFPRLTESVAWISGRTDVLAAVFGLGALWLFRPGPGHGGRRAMAGVALLGGLLCKEVAVAAAVAMAVWSIVETAGQARLRRIGRDLLPVVAALAVYAGLRLRAMGLPTTEDPDGFRKPLSVLWVFGEAQARYVWMIVDAFRPRLQMGDRFYPSWPISLLGLGLLVAAAGWTWRARARISGPGWMALGLGGPAVFLVSHLIYLDMNPITADRFLYLPIAALMIGLSGMTERAFRNQRRILLPGLFTLIGIFAMTTAWRARLWGNELALWRFEVKSSPASFAIPRIELALALFQRGRYTEALPILQKVPPEYQALTVLNRATCLDKLGRRAEAVALLETTMASVTKPALRSRVMINLALLYARGREFSKARTIGAAIAVRLSDRQDILALLEKVAMAEAEWVALPPETADEPLVTRVARATWFAKLGALSDAQDRFARIAQDPSANPEAVSSAVSFLVFEGREDLARASLAVLAKRGLMAQDLPALRTALADRFDDGE